MNAFEVIRSLQPFFESDVNYRFDCPFCQGKKTLTVTKTYGTFVWNCYKASCSTRGVRTTSLSVRDIQALRKPKELAQTSEFTAPSSFISPIWHNEALDYMNQMHCMQAWSEGAVQMYYDPPQDRVVFMITDKAGTVIDANGRSLKNKKPKWLRYGKSHQPFVCNRNKDTAVIVEDAASACAVYPNYTGIALLGTNLTVAAANELKDYKRVLVCLDPDATSKALEMRNKLAYICDKVSSVIIPNDLKYFNSIQIKEILN